jgi:hypothetical protein
MMAPRPLLLVSRAAALVVVGGLLAIPGCSNETIVLASIPVTDSGIPAPPPQRCAESSTCPTGYYCSMPSCDAQTGTCVLPPAVCDATESPVCGCDHITYFNDCLRQANGVSASTASPCQDTGWPCGPFVPGSCPDGAKCAQLGGFMHGPCDHDIPGTCWVLPASCVTTTPSDYWDSCVDTGGACLDLCSAIRAGGPYRRSQQCP